LRILIHDYAGHAFPIELSRALANRGHTVVHAFASHLLTPRGELNRLDDDAAGLSFQPVPMSTDYRKNKYSFIKRLGYERSYGNELVKLIGVVKPELILSGQTPSDPQFAFTQAANGSGIPMLMWVQDFYSLAVDQLARKKLPVVGFLAGWWYRRLDRHCFSGSAGVVAITEDFVPVLQSFGVRADRITVIPNWASLVDIQPVPQHNPWSVFQGLSDNFVFLYSGTLAMKHNPELILVIARRFRTDDNVRVVVVSEGPGAEYLRLRKLAESLKNLILLPFQEFSVMPEVLGSAGVVMAILEADAGVFSVPSKVLTYHAAGKPILAAIPNENLAARIINQQVSGLCSDSADQEAFVRNAERLYGDESERQAMAQRARAYAEREFDIERITDRFEEVFAKAMNVAKRVV
jgi:colanic acid biosynthesis glycosyl transferase WcaI